MATLNRLTHLETSLENLPRGREFKYSPSLIASASECELPTRESVLGSLAALSTTMFGDTYERSYPEYVRCFVRVLTIDACGQALRVLYLFFVIFLSVVCQKKTN
jgi:hypothetical protein